jgi:hypothetical protein
MRQHPDTSLDPKGYVADFRDTLLPQVTLEDFEADLSSGDGNELETKFRAAHSSSGLAVNCFAPFRSRIADLAMPMGAGFDDLRFERKCPTGLRGGRAPNLDVVLSGPLYQRPDYLTRKGFPSAEKSESLSSNDGGFDVS